MMPIAPMVVPVATGRQPRVAIACSGLGRVRRGNETWAQTVAEGLHRNGHRVELFGGGPLPSAKCPYSQISNIPREFLLTRSWLSWHYRYLGEQLSAMAALLLESRWRPFDIFHVADPDMALQVRRRTQGTHLRVIYKDGLLLGPQFCQKFDFVQILAPYYLERAQDEGVDTRNWFVIPHLVNAGQFCPASDKVAIRKTLLDRLPPDAFVVLAVGAFSPSSSKRLGWIVREFAATPWNTPTHLFLAGQSDNSDFAALERQARSLLGDRVHFFRNLPAEEMTKVYQAADVLAHAALQEPFGIALLEAMASGLPVLGHRFPVTEWIIGDGGNVIDMTEPGRLAAILWSWKRDSALRRSLGERARQRAMTVFAEERIIPLYRDMYEDILARTTLPQ